MTNTERLKRIAEIIEHVDTRCMAVDGPVTPTLQEMRQSEISEIYKLASQQNVEADAEKSCGFDGGKCQWENNVCVKCRGVRTA